MGHLLSISDLPLLLCPLLAQHIYLNGVRGELLPELGILCRITGGQSKDLGRDRLALAHQFLQLHAALARLIQVDGAGGLALPQLCPLHLELGHFAAEALAPLDELLPFNRCTLDCIRSS